PFGGPRVQIGWQARQKVISGQVFRYQITASAKPAPASLENSQRLGRGNPQKSQTIALHPAMPGTTGSPEALQPVPDALDVVALDHQGTPCHFNQRHRGTAALLERLAGGNGAIRVPQQRPQEIELLAPNDPQASQAALHRKLGAF